MHSRADVLREAAAVMLLVETHEAKLNALVNVEEGSLDLRLPRALHKSNVKIDKLLSQWGQRAVGQDRLKVGLPGFAEWVQQDLGVADAKPDEVKR